jgi:hypothetical protein
MLARRILLTYKPDTPYNVTPRRTLLATLSIPQLQALSVSRSRTRFHIFYHSSINQSAERYNK